jgi:hypothetical protein
MQILPLRESNGFDQRNSEFLIVPHTFKFSSLDLSGINAGASQDMISEHGKQTKSEVYGRNMNRSDRRGVVATVDALARASQYGLPNFRNQPTRYATGCIHQGACHDDIHGGYPFLMNLISTCEVGVRSLLEPSISRCCVLFFLIRMNNEHRISRQDVATPTS